jgi:hypothetical protein
VAIVSRATTPWEETLEGTLEDIVAKVERDKPKAPALIVVGEVVAHRVRSEATVPGKAAGARGLSDGTDAKPSRSVLEATRASEAPVSEVAWA